MSIIYDALKKVETKVDATNKNTSDLKTKKSQGPKRKFITWRFYVLAICLGFMAAYFFFNYFAPQEKLFLIKDTLLAKFLPKKAELPAKSKTRIEIKQKIEAQNIVPQQPSPPGESASITASTTQIKPANVSAEDKFSMFSDQSKQQRPLSLNLNGVFISGEEVYALINNRVLRVGDVIEGATVKRITQDTVELEYADSIITLYTH